jgi:riboflavin-specific deaminase-like protein
MNPKSNAQPSPRSRKDRDVSKPSAGPLPFLFLNLAMTADGKITTANRAASSFGTRRDREHMLELRATADAVISGARTVDLNPINMGPGTLKFRRLRLRRGLPEFNLRVIVSGSGSVNPQAEIFKHTFSPIIILTTNRVPPGRLRKLREVANDVWVSRGKEMDFAGALRWLRAKWNVKRLLCEGGGELDDALFRAGLVNELHLTVCPRIFGGRNAPTIADGVGTDSLAKASRLELKSAIRHSDEVYFVYRVLA